MELPRQCHVITWGTTKTSAASGLHFAINILTFCPKYKIYVYEHISQCT